MLYDLHTHSYYSDGLLTPRQLVKKAKEVGLMGIALTDHDTVVGIGEFLKAGKELDLWVQPGIELSTQYQGVEVHILGYCFDYNHPGLLTRLEEVMVSRQKRGRRILNLLRKHGFDLSLEDVLKDAPGGFVGRPQIYRALKEKKLIGEDADKSAFNYYLGSAGVAYVPHRELSSIEAIDLVREAGGLPFLAHPGRSVNYTLLRNLTEKGLAGVEVYHSSHTPEQVSQYLAFAKELGLLISGGSDYHGVPGEVDFGLLGIKQELMEKIFG